MYWSTLIFDVISRLSVIDDGDYNVDDEDYTDDSNAKLAASSPEMMLNNFCNRLRQEDGFFDIQLQPYHMKIQTKKTFIETRAKQICYNCEKLHHSRFSAIKISN